MLSAELNDLIEVALLLRQQHPETPAREILDAVLRAPPGADLQADASLRLETDWLSPCSAWAPLLREAFAPEVEDDYPQLLQDPDPEVRAVLQELWARTVVRRFRRRYLGVET